MFRAGKKLSAVLLIIVVSAVFLMNTAAANASSKERRLFGSDRYETAVAISREGWASAKYAVLARGDNFPDALCAGPLAKKFDAPVLLTETNRLNFSVMEELKRLGVTNVMIAGGLGAVSQAVEDELISQGMIVERISGADRYETSVKIAEKLGTVHNLALATGSGFPDALSVSAIAASTGMPILLTDRITLPDSVKQYIESRNIQKTYIIGGQGVISDRVLDSVPGGERIAGADRFETNVEVMKKFIGDLDFNQVFLAVADGPKGDEFADALAGSALAAKTKSPVVLIYKTLPLITENFVKPRMTRQSTVTALGGAAVVPPEAVEDLLNIDESSVYVKAVNPPAAMKVGETLEVSLDLMPSGAAIKAVSSNPGAVSVTVSGNALSLRCLSQGTAVITVTASMSGYNDGVTSFVISPPVYNVTKDTYYETIQKAIDYSSPGDTIKIGSGVYYEHITITKNNLKFIGADRDTTIIDASQTGGLTRAGIKIRNVSGIEVKNLTVRNSGVNMTRENGREPYGIYIRNSDKNLFENLKLQNNGEYEIYMFDGCDLNTVKDCIIDGRGTSEEGYLSLDGIFSSGGESGKSSMNTGNKFINNTIKNVVSGIALTASEGNEILNNKISVSDSIRWQGFTSAGIILSNSSANLVQGNTIDTGKYGVRLSILSGMSPYAYAGTPNVNTVKGNTIISSEYGIRVMGTGNKIEDNSISGNTSGGGIWLSPEAKTTKVAGNILTNNKTGILVENVLNEVYFNKITGGTTGVKNTTGTRFNAAKNWWDSSQPLSKVEGDVAYSPWLGTGYDGDSSAPGFQVPSPMTWCTDGSLKDAMNSASAGDTIELLEGTYSLDEQFVVYKNIKIVGAGKGKTILKINFDTAIVGDGRGAILVSAGRALNLSNLTVEGKDKKVMEAIRILGSGIIHNVEMKDIYYDTFSGYGVYASGSSDITVKGSGFSGIGRAAVGVYDSALVTIGGDKEGEGNTFTGSGEGSFIEYGVIINKGSGNASATIRNNKFTGYSGTSSSGSWSSSGIVLEAGTAAITGNIFEGCPEAVKVWVGSTVNGAAVEVASAGDAARVLAEANGAGEGFGVVIYGSDGKVVYPAAPEVPAEPATGGE